MPRISMFHRALQEAQPQSILNAGYGAAIGSAASSPMGDIHQFIDGEAYAWSISQTPTTRRPTELDFYPDSDF